MQANRPAQTLAPSSRPSWRDWATRVPSGSHSSPSSSKNPSRIRLTAKAPEQQRVGLRQRGAEMDRQVDRRRRRELGEPRPGRRKPGVGEHGDRERVERTALEQAEPATGLGVVGAGPRRVAEAMLHRQPLGERRRIRARELLRASRSAERQLAYHYGALAAVRPGRGGGPGRGARWRASASRRAAGPPRAPSRRRARARSACRPAERRPLTVESERPWRSTVALTLTGPALGARRK